MPPGHLEAGEARPFAPGRKDRALDQLIVREPCRHRIDEEVSCGDAPRPLRRPNLPSGLPRDCADRKLSSGLGVTERAPDRAAASRPAMPDPARRTAAKRQDSKRD